MTPVTSSSTAWSVPNFRRLWTASAASSLGSEVAEIAVPMLVILTLSASATEVGWLRAAQFLPFLLVTLPLGVLVDRWRGRRLSLLVGADTGRFVLFAALPLLVWAGVSNVALFYPLVFAIGTLTVLYQVADFAFLPSVVGAHQLVDANGKIAATSSASEIAGRGLGGLLVQAVTAPAAIALTAVTFGLSALSLRRIKVGQLDSPPEESLEEPRRPARQEILEGLRHAFTNRYIRALLGEAATFNLFNELFIIGLLLWTLRDLDLGAFATGLIFTAGGLGSFLGAWFGARATERFGYGRVLLLTMAVGNTAPLAAALADRAAVGPVAVLCALFTLVGLGSGIANVHAVSLRQTTLPEELRGRVNAAYRLISWGAIPVGAAVGGLAAARIGGQGTMLIGAAGMAVATLWVAISPVPRLRRIEEAHPPSSRSGS
ncbi:MFS transporter [Aeromicrobium senzhongii]|uniref:MFS transporter n=2 Tax=Aeromicrobium senzhongii TaxID=2663859 RepID=A0ABX6SXU6_9ACTN|nr:MFS transporter [Aeromicrobium senzhongii]QNL95090.1 MFS transporter [Aeromicrobium senzhongii]